MYVHPRESRDLVVEWMEVEQDPGIGGANHTRGDKSTSAVKPDSEPVEMRESAPRRGRCPLISEGISGKQYENKF